MAVIELGDVGVHAAGPPPTGWRSEFGSGPLRRLGALLVAVVCLLLPGASNRPATPLVHDIWSTEITNEDARTVRSDGVYVHRAVKGRGMLTAYDLATGVARWTLATEGRVSWMHQGADAGVLLTSGDERVADVEFEDGSQGQIAYGGTTAALDARTGTRLWEAPGEVQSASPAGVLLAERNRGGEFTTLRLIQTRAGTDIWQRPVTGIRYLLVPHADTDPTRIVLADSGGHTTVLRHTDGSAIADRRLPWAPPQPSAGIDTSASVANGLLLISRGGPASNTITAYRIDSLRRLWETKTTLAGYVQGCGVVVCLLDNSEVHGMDPLSARRIWRLSGRSGITLLRGDRMFVAMDIGDPPAQALIDPATGQSLGPLAQGLPFWSPLAAGSAVMVHSSDGDGLGRSSVSHLDLDTGRIKRVGAMGFTDPMSARCDYVPGYLVCQRAERLVATAVG